MLSKRKYVLDLLQETRKIGCKLADTPIDPNHKLREASEDATVDKGMYQILVGKLIYLSHTRLNIAYALSLVSQFMHNSKEVDLQAVYRILQIVALFLEGTWKLGRLKIILEDLKIKWETPIRLYCDNKSAINIAHNLANANALKLSCELLRVFVIEAVERAATIAEAEGVNKIEATHLERILPQLLLDF
ncbi:Protein MHF2-like [Vitis vinifera]|uniref:Protein MHF2-like n=1 Tax=Vitis vinifera TaxID=29760 RepID=A0A438GSI9_VITVI|nr:Protein MHF2-like [Vitis vinifera]